LLNINVYYKTKKKKYYLVNSEVFIKANSIITVRQI